MRRRALLAGAAVAASIPLTARPALAAPAPPVDDTSTWGAAAPRGSVTVNNVRAVRVIVHHAVTSNTTNYTRAQAHAHARQIQNIHFDNGWIDTGYHFVVSRGGYITEGRHRSLETIRTGDRVVQGAHTQGYNTNSIGICMEGTYTSVQPTQTQWDSLVDMVAYACGQYGVSANDIFGHRDFNSTACPGNAFYPRLPELRDAVRAIIG
ncbi:MAG: peptidoglycan recognition protein family protein [Stackebrandtia sp.]